MSEKIIANVISNEIVLEGTIDSNGNLKGIIETKDTLNGSIYNNIVLYGEISNEDSLQGSLGATTLTLKTNKHNELINRNLPNQHPIDAIEGLREELMSIKNSQGDTNLSIKSLNTKINNKIRTVKQVPSDMKVGEYIFLEKGE